MDDRSVFRSTRFLLLLLCFGSLFFWQQVECQFQQPFPQPQQQQPIPQNFPFPAPQNPVYNPFQQPQPFYSGQVNYYGDMRNLYPYGAGTRDVRLVDREAQTGKQIDLFSFFPYYGGKFNYSIISVHGYITFGDMMEDGLDFLMGDEVTNWPTNPDPATIAVFACRQKEAASLPFDQKGVYYRLVFRQDMYKNIPGGQAVSSQMKYQNYIDPYGDYFLDQLREDLRDGMVGAANFHPDVALVVTWENMTFYQASREDAETKRATYQAVFATDRAAQLSYVMLNYHSLGYAGSDIYGQTKRGRCKAQFNGGNQTGTVLVDPVNSKFPLQLALMSAVPHRVGGRYLFRVDDIVRKGGCSNMSAGTYRMTIYPDLVNAMGDVNVQVNGLCLLPTSEPILQIAEFKPSICKVKNAAIAECQMIRYYQWGTKSVYLQVGTNKVYVGSIYYVPPGLDPFQLDVGRIETWYSRIRPPQHRIGWYPGNFTNERGERIGSLRLALWGYKEQLMDQDKKFVPVLEKIGMLNSGVPNPTDRRIEYQILDFTAQTPQWIGDGERQFWTYRFGFLRLYAEDQLVPGGEGGGIWSPPIPLHFWWGTDPNNVPRIAVDMCMDWYKQDGMQWNFIMDTETNSSCPCRLEQAYIDLGRYMPHPRCSQHFRNLGCDAYVGAKECFLSAENVQGNYVTHYGQVCCYDRDGYLMQTSYQSVVQVENYPYSPGFPQRAYEFGTYPFTKQFEIPTLSNYYHDVLPYFFCCKWVPDHCQFFYWRRPSSGCQNYQPPGVATVMGAGHFITFDNLQYTFNEPGTYIFLQKPEVRPLYNRDPMQYNRDPMIQKSPPVLIEIRMERYPNRMVDFSHRDIPQFDLVQPENVSVITGVALQEGSSKESDRVVFSLRKDTRRVKYRLNVIVNDEIRYFDVVKTQKFRGVTIYVNDWKEGQSEIYCSLEKTRIGLRIRESYAVEIIRQLNFEESYGLLDVLVSIPPEYRVQPDYTGAIFWDFAVAGLVGTFSNTTQDDFVDPTTHRPSGGTSGSSETVAQFARMWKVDNNRFPDLFTLLSQDHETYPEALLLGPVYPFSVIQDGPDHPPYVPQYDTIFQQNYMHCMATRNDPYCPDPSMMADIDRLCLQMYQCQYDYFETRQSVLAVQIKQEWNAFKENRDFGMQRFNSCGAINIEYPEYLLIDPPTGKLYLEGDTVHFDCYQDHWIKGQNFFRCLQGGWTKGYQPWCRSKQLENTQKILAIVFGVLLSLLLVIGLFMCCFCIRKSKTEKTKTYKNVPEPIDRGQLGPSTGKEAGRVTVSGAAETRPLMTASGQPTSRVTAGQPAYDTWEPERVRDEPQRRPTPIVEAYPSDGSSPPSYGRPPIYNMQGSPARSSPPIINAKKTLV